MVNVADREGDLAFVGLDANDLDKDVVVLVEDFGGVGDALERQLAHMYHA